MGEGISRIPVRFRIEGLGEAKGSLIRFFAPRTVEALLRAMPLHGITAAADGILYFSVPVKLGLEKPRTQVDEGAVAYWPMGSAVCIVVEKTRPYSPVNLIGRLTENIDLFRRAGGGRRVMVDKA
ncbi:MAG: cyclophilin-like family protein [Candidatus Bathyarchaeia archaeon]